jgi:hypothetical protein
VRSREVVQEPADPALSNDAVEALIDLFFHHDRKFLGHEPLLIRAIYVKLPTVPMYLGP